MSLVSGATPFSADLCPVVCWLGAWRQSSDGSLFEGDVGLEIMGVGAGFPAGQDRGTRIRPQPHGASAWAIGVSLRCCRRMSQTTLPLAGRTSHGYLVRGVEDRAGGVRSVTGQRNPLIPELWRFMTIERGAYETPCGIDVGLRASGDTSGGWSSCDGAIAGVRIVVGQPGIGARSVRGADSGGHRQPGQCLYLGRIR